MISWFRSFFGTKHNLQNQICTKDPQATGCLIHEQESTRLYRSLVKMEVAVPEEPQKKIFRARKTMKMSDRQQLEALHNTLTTSSSASYSSSSSQPQTPLVNGTHPEKEKEKEKEKVMEKDLNHKEADLMLPAPDSARCSPSPSVSPSPSPLNTQPTSPSMDLDDPLVATDEKKETSNKSSSSSLSASPSGLNCDPEVKEGFLCLSEEDEIQADRDDNKESSEENMNVDAEKEDQKEEEGTSENAGDISSPAGTKRSLSEEKDEDDEEIKAERDGKRARLEGEELEAQLELKITANAGSRHKLEKMVQQLVEDRLRVLQLTVFDRSLKELKERVEKIDNATKQQNALQHINTLQAKISRLAKKFGAANQASENSKRTQEVHAASAAQANTANMTTPQRTVKTTVDPKLSSPPTGSSSTAIPAQPKPLSTPTTPASSALAAPAPILQIISTTTSSTPSSTSLPGQSQTGTLLLKTGPGTGVMTNTPVTSGGQSVSIQPLLIQLPLAMANGQSGALVNAAGGVGLIPVSSLSTVSSINKAKTTTPATTFILQKPAGSVVSSSSTSSAPAVSLARAVYPGGTGIVSSPSTGISVTTARTPTQCAAVVGVSTAASSPGTTGPAATGSAAAAAGPPSASALASKTDNQASTPKTPSQPGRPKGSVIDLTEDDDDVQVTGVQKATVSPITTQRASGPPPLVSSTTNAGSGVRTAQRSSVDSPSLSRPSSSSSTSLPPLPLAPSPPARLPPEAAHTSPPQQPQLKLARVQSQNGIVLSWCVAETDRNCAAVDTYHLYAYHQDNQGTASGASAQSLWKKIGEVKALPLPMACTLTQFVSGSTYYFAVRAKDVYGRFGPFCEPQCTDVINPASSASS
ncbi:activating transcription factor 7-interacting protein 1 isoform X2 [Ctenopharyngodon idella]|uniref:activating transcription factor 7-interacting protein 1 isoform X2 n=1 Tax=Ctenopharyngodon idella TaxID=7959 RepID=UPI00222E296C|nr:activating transcription factor 7-interacting protein 1 isoform X2 [Ctenopharyngodon idella]